MLGLRSGSRNSALTELLARRFASPGTRINVADSTQPLFGFLEGRKVPHVQAESLTSFLKAPAHEEAETLELGLLGIRQSHRRSRRAQIEDERACRTLRLFDSTVPRGT